MSREWKLKVEMSASSYEGLRQAIRCWSDQIAKIESFKDLWTANQGYGDSGGNEWGYNTECESPVEARITALRQEADQLERGIGGSR